MIFTSSQIPSINNVYPSDITYESLIVITGKIVLICFRSLVKNLS